VILDIFYNHLAHEREEVLKHIQELQQDTNTQNQEEIAHLKQEMVILQAGMKQVLNEKKA
jgi:uncharacterized protein YdcH (DUF465 family)